MTTTPLPEPQHREGIVRVESVGIWPKLQMKYIVTTLLKPAPGQGKATMPLPRPLQSAKIMCAKITCAKIATFRR